jgi:hypothetical protein
MVRTSHVHDGTMNLIFFDQYVTDDKKEFMKLSNEQYLKAVKTICAPAIIIELKDWKIRYYYRAICWDKTVLIGVSFINGIWLVKQYYENPSGAFVLTLLKSYLVQGDKIVFLQNEMEKMP